MEATTKMSWIMIDEILATVKYPDKLEHCKRELLKEFLDIIR